VSARDYPEALIPSAQREGAVSTTVERIRGIDEPLPAGERVLWQGAPDWRVLAVGALHVRKVVFYFGLLALWQLAAGVVADRPAASMAVGAAGLALMAAVVVGLLAGFAWLAARTTIYAITTRRVVMRIGVAMPIFVNLPFTGIEAAALKPLAHGCGDIPLTLTRDVRLAYLHLWPHARPWQLAHPQPMLRAVPDAECIAALLAEQLARTGGVASVRALAVERHDDAPVAA
jgi:hypothetical protein